MKWASALLLAVVVGAGYFWSLDRSGEPDAWADSGDLTDQAAGQPLVREALQESAVDDADSLALPDSLQGTQPPGGWGPDPDGHWEVTPELRLLFDYYLTALGEAPLEELVAHIRQSLASLPPDARREAMAVLEDYLGFRLALTELEEASGPTQSLSPGELAERLERIRALRRSTLGDAVAETFYSEDEALADYALARARILADEGLEDEERQARLTEAESMLPEHMRASRQAARSFREYREQVSELERSGAPREMIDALRAQQFGEEAAERLQEVDRERAQWDRRLAEYREEVAQLEAAGLSEPDLAEERQRLLERHFEEHEQTRVRALEQMNRTGDSAQTQ